MSQSVFDFVMSVDKSLTEKHLPSYLDVLSCMNTLAFYVRHPAVQGDALSTAAEAEGMVEMVTTLTGGKP